MFNLKAHISEQEIARHKMAISVLNLKKAGVIFAISDDEVLKSYRNLRTSMPVICPECRKKRNTSTRGLLLSTRGSICQTCAFKLGLFSKSPVKKKKGAKTAKGRLKDHIEGHDHFTKFLCKKWVA